TPYEALTGCVPGLAGLPVWGAQVWVHDTSTGKLGERAKAGRWVGFDSQSKGHRVYWPDGRRITVERNLRFTNTPDFVHFEDDGPELEGEEVKSSYVKPMSTDSPASESEPSADESDGSDDAPDEPHTPPPPPKPEILDTPPTPRPVRICKPSQRVSDMLAGKGADKTVPRGIPLPKENAPTAVIAELVEEITGAAMAAHVADAEGLDPRSINEARRRPEWPR
ncbi:hypothetical protein DAEQUDRAFT_644385, partial [Daedalea quercina L-15889]